MKKCSHWAPEEGCKSCEKKFAKIARKIRKIVKKNTGVDVRVTVTRW